LTASKSRSEGTKALGLSNEDGEKEEKEERRLSSKVEKTAES
jgi:hypothetical protein